MHNSVLVGKIEDEDCSLGFFIFYLLYYCLLYTFIYIYYTLTFFTSTEREYISRYQLAWPIVPPMGLATFCIVPQRLSDGQTHPNPRFSRETPLYRAVTLGC